MHWRYGKWVASAIFALPIAVHANGWTERAISANTLAVIVNDADPYSVATAEYYVTRRRVPSRNVIHVRIAPRPTLSAVEFNALYAQIAAQTHTSVQAYAVAWVQPYRVDCMSITSAIAVAGFDAAYCAEGCKLTKPSPYFNSPTSVPANALGMFPTMLIAAPSVEAAKSLVDRGVASDGAQPKGAAYLVTSGDSARNVRAARYPDARNLDLKSLRLERPHIDQMHNRHDVMFYFVGARALDDMTSNRFLPGAIADHLTSTGGDLLHSRQMSSLRWIEAGATGSYGSVVEPCAFVEKFPDPVIMMKFYLAGETLIEAYWKSVAMPGQGVFIGEPLARPFTSGAHR
jgi:uncharacterized protein (TIGR03790 family)